MSFFRNPFQRKHGDDSKRKKGPQGKSAASAPVASTPKDVVRAALVKYLNAIGVKGAAAGQFKSSLWHLIGALVDDPSAVKVIADYLYSATQVSLPTDKLLEKLSEIVAQLKSPATPMATDTTLTVGQAAAGVTVSNMPVPAQTASAQSIAPLADDPDNGVTVMAWPVPAAKPADPAVAPVNGDSATQPLATEEKRKTSSDQGPAKGTPADPKKGAPEGEAVPAAKSAAAPAKPKLIDKLWNKVLENRGWAVLALLLLAAVAIFMSGGKSANTELDLSAFNFQAAALDSTSAPFNGYPQVFTFILLLAVIFYGRREGLSRGQLSDFIAAVEFVAVVMFSPYILDFCNKTMLQVWPNDFTADGLAKIKWLFSAVILLLEARQLRQAMVNGGFDRTPLNLALIMLGGLGMLLGRLGLFQTLLFLPDTPVVPLIQLPQYFVAKQYNMIFESLLCASLIGAGVAGSVLELRPILNAADVSFRDKLTALGTSVTGVLTYFVLRFAAPSVAAISALTPLGWFLGASFAGVVAGTRTERHAEGAQEKADGVAHVASPRSVAWDKMIGQAGLALLLILFFGKV